MRISHVVSKTLDRTASVFTQPTEMMRLTMIAVAALAMCSLTMGTRRARSPPPAASGSAAERHSSRLQQTRRFGLCTPLLPRRPPAAAAGRRWCRAGVRRSAAEPVGRSRQAGLPAARWVMPADGGRVTTHGCARKAQHTR